MLPQSWNTPSRPPLQTQLMAALNPTRACSRVPDGANHARCSHRSHLLSQQSALVRWHLSHILHVAGQFRIMSTASLNVSFADMLPKSKDSGIFRQSKPRGGPSQPIVFGDLSNSGPPETGEGSGAGVPRGKVGARGGWEAVLHGSGSATAGSKATRNLPPSTCRLTQWAAARRKTGQAR